MKLLTTLSLALLSLHLSAAVPTPFADPSFMPAGGLGPAVKPGITTLTKPAAGSSCLLGCNSIAAGCEQQCLTESWTSAACKTCLGPNKVAEQSICANCYIRIPPPAAAKPVNPKTPTDDARFG
ncbi:hypothetical protein MMC14_003582 [Varicellaria rhodocarpa]|nr:hypothetical protein [Varicellaria rhodocarpa]